MSMQRILETARKLGIPVVVTDPSGREPYVLLPLDQFEAMAGEQQRTSNVEKISLNQEKKTSDAISLEDQFYIEPVDESDRI